MNANNFIQEISSDINDIEIKADDIKFYKTDKQFIFKGNVNILLNQYHISSPEVKYSFKDGKIDSVHKTILQEIEKNNDKLLYNITADKMTFYIKDDKGVMEGIYISNDEESHYIVAPKMELKNKNLIILNQALYSSCKFCNKQQADKILWSLSSKQIKIDKEKNHLYAYHAKFKLFNIPVLYTPFVYLPLDLKRETSGFITPSYEEQSNLGLYVKTPIYFRAKENMDITYTPYWFLQKKNILHEVENRYLFKNGYYNFLARYIKENDALVNINQTTDRQKWNIALNGEFGFDNEVDLLFDINEISDKDFFRKYRFSTELLFKSSILLQQHGSNHFQSLQLNKWDDFRDVALFNDDYLRLNNLGSNNLVLPHYQNQYNIIINDKLFFSSNSEIVNYLISKKEDSVTRLSQDFQFDLPYLSKSGHKFNFGIKLQNDLYNMNIGKNNANIINGNSLLESGYYSNEDKVQYRVIPSVYGVWEHPLIKQMNNLSIVLTPKAQFSLTKTNNNRLNISNIDSVASDITAYNIFSNSLFSGRDRAREGLNVMYGMKTSILYQKNIEIDLILGKTYHNHLTSFLYYYSDIKNRNGDYVASFDLKYKDKFLLSYHNRISQDKFIIYRHELNAEVNFDRFSLNTQYLMYDDQKVFQTVLEKYNVNSLSNQFNFKLNDNWKMYAGFNYNFKVKRSNKMINQSLGLAYNGKCFSVKLDISKDNTIFYNTTQGMSYALVFSLKNLSGLSLNYSD